MLSNRVKPFASAWKSGAQSNSMQRAVCGMTLLAVSLNLGLATTQAAMAQSRPGATAATHGAHGSTLNFDLSSTNRTLMPPTNLGDNSISIKSGTGSRVIDAQSLLTPAERLAVWQVISTGAQSIRLGMNGNAVGGSFSLSPKFNFDISSLVIPKGVTSLSSVANLNILGDLNNSGALRIANIIGGASISANNIINNYGALISSASALNLIAANNITNYGQITGASSLTFTAGNSISNVGNAGSISAANNVNLLASNIVNSGAISALAGNINVASVLPSSITFNNNGGVLSALTGDINVRDSLFSGKYNTNLIGGDLLSNNVNIFGGNGTVEMNTHSATGLVNITASNIHAGVNSGTFNLGAMNFTDDPVFFNTGGSLSVNSAISGATVIQGAPVALLASGDITSTSGGSINTLDGATGFPLFVMAGANFTVSSKAAGSTTTSTQGNGDISSVFTITGPSVTGGAVDFSAFSSAISTVGTANGGNVSITAFSGTGKGSTLTPGTVNLGTNAINTNGGGTGLTNGSVTIIAGAKSDPSGGSVINVGAINTASSGGGLSGGVLLVTGSPKITVPFVITNGNISSGAMGFTSVNNGSITIGSASTPGNIAVETAPVTILAGKTISLNGSITSGGVNTVSPLGPGGIVTMIAGGNIQSAATGNIGITTTGEQKQFTGSPIYMIAGASYTANATHNYSNNGLNDEVVANIKVVGASSTGGNISLAKLNNIQAKGGAINGTDGFAGGSVNLTAFASAASPTSTGQVNLPTVGISTGGTASGGTVASATSTLNGDVVIVAGGSQTGSTPVLQVSSTSGTIDTTGGNQGGGSISIVAAKPIANSTNPFLLTYDTTAPSKALSVTGSVGPSTSLTNGNVVVGAMNAAGGYFQVPPPPSGSATTAPTTISVRTSGAVNVTGNISNANNTLPAGGPPGMISSSTINLESGGVMTFSNSASVSSNAQSANTTVGYGVNGGTINLKAGSFASAGTVTLNANGTGGYSPYNMTGPLDATGGDGGNINITTTSTAGGTVNIANAANGFTINAASDTTGGNGGKLTVNSASAINVTSSSISMNPSVNNLADSGFGTQYADGGGATINLTAASTVAITGTLSVNGAPGTLASGSGLPSGNGGSLNIVMNSSQAFNVGGASSGGNGVTTGGLLTANGNLGGSGQGFGSGGSISINNLGTGGVVLQNFVLQVQGSNASVGLLGSANQSYVGGSGGNITLTGKFVQSANTIDASGGGFGDRGSGNGGSIKITTNSTTPFVVDPSATLSPTFNGVKGSLTANGNVIGSSPSGVGSVYSTLPTGSGGSISVTNNAGGITIGSGAVISVAAANANSAIGTIGGDGGTIILKANGAVQSAIALSANGGTESAPTATAVTSVVGTTISVASTAGFFPGQVITLNGLNSKSAQQTEAVAINSIVSNTQIDVFVVVNSYASGITVQPYFTSGNGGTIIVSSNSATQMKVGTPSSSSNSTGNLSATGYMGGTITVENTGKGGIAVANNSINSNPVAPAASIGPTLLGFGGFGGNVSLLAANGPVSVAGGISVNGVGTGSPTAGPAIGGLGGNIVITSNSTTQFQIGNGTVTNGVAGNLVSNGGSGVGGNGDAGTITVTSFGTGGISATTGGVQLTPGTANFGAAGNGGQLVLQALKGILVLGGNIVVAGGTQHSSQFADGLGGTVSLTSNSTIPFTVDGTATITNGVGGSINVSGWSAGSISINNLGKGGISIANGMLDLTPNNANVSVIKNGQDVGGAGGQIVLQSALGNVFVSGDLNVSGGAQFQSNSSGNILLSAGAAGQIAILSGSSVPFTIGGATSNGISGNLIGNGANGGIVNVTAKGTGGIIVSNASNIQLTGQTGATCTSCNGTASTLILNGGNGGSIYLQALGTNGKVFISGNAQTGGLNASGAPATDTSAVLPAGDGAGNGGIISIVTNSTTAFNLGAAASNTNGIGSGGAGLTAAGNNGGSIGIKNLGTGGIQFDPSLISVSSAAGATSSGTALPAGNGGNIDLESPTGIITATAAGNLSASATNNTNGTGGNGGTVTINAKQINMTTSAPLTITAIASTNPGDIGIGGSVFLTQTTTTAAQALNVGRSTPINISVAGTPGNSTSGNILVNSPAGINIPGGLTSGDNSGSITLIATANNPITQAGTTDIQTGTLNVKVGPGGTGPTGLDVNVQNLNVASTGGNINISSQNDLTITSATLTGSTTATMNIGVSNGNLTVAASGPVNQSITVVSSGPLSLSANGGGTGNIAINGSISAPTVTLDASGGTSTGGSVTTGLLATIYAPNKLLLSMGVDGTSGSLSTQTGLLNLTTNGSSAVTIANFGNLVVSNTTTVSTGTISILNVGSMVINGSLKADTVSLSTQTGFNNSDSITLNGVVGNGAANGSVTIASAGGLQETALGLVSANSVVLNSLTGNIGFLTRTANSSNIYTPAGSSFNVDLVPNSGSSGTLSVSTGQSPQGGAGNIYVNITNSGLNPSGNANVTSISAGGDVYITTNLVNNGIFELSGAASSNNGAITILNSNTGSGAVNINANMTALGGPLTIQNNNGINASGIAVADNVTLSGVGWLFNSLSTGVNAQSGVALINGAFPTTPVAGSTPSGVTQTGAGANFFYGLGANIVNTANFNATGNATIVLQGTNTASISIGDGVIVNANSSVLNITSLDLTNSTVRNALITLQGNPNSGISGKLTSTGTGTLNFDTTTANVPFSLANLNSMNIPAAATVTFANFGVSNPVSVNAATSGTSKINGAVKFLAVNGISSGSPTPNAFLTNANMSFNTSVVGQVLNIAAGSSVISDNNLTINIGGSSTIAGTLTAGANGILGIHAGQAVAATTSPTSTTVPTGTITMTKAVLSAGAVGDNGVVRVFAPSISGSASSVTANSASLWATAGVNYQVKAIAPVLIKSGELTAFSGFSTGTTSIFTTVGVNTKITATSTSNINNLLLIAAGPVTLTHANPFTVAGLVLNDLAITTDKLTVAPVSGYVFNSSDLGANNVSVTTKEIVNNAGTIYSNNSQTKVNFFATTGQALKVTMTDGISNGSVFAGNGITITGSSGVSILGGNYNSAAGLIALNESSKGMTISGASFTAGTLTGLPVNPVLNPNEIQTRGDVKITVGAGGLTTGDAASFTANGGNVSVLSTGGTLNLSGIYTANGGNISILNSGKVTSTTDFVANAAAVGTVATNAVGGIIEVTAGTNLSQINNLSTVPGTLPTDPLFIQPEGGPPLPLGSNVAINNNAAASVNYGTGSVLQNVTSGGVYNLGNSPTAQTVFNLYGGGMVFSVGSTGSLTMQGSDLTVNSLSPISFKERNHGALDLEFDSDDIEAGAMAHVFAPGYSESLLLTDKGISSIAELGTAKFNARKTNSKFTLKTGSMFMNPVVDTVIHTDLADVHAKKGALLSVSTEEGGLRVAVCSGPGHVSLHVGDSEITLTAGEEVIISDHKLTESEQGKADGIGRRHFSNYKLSANRHVSICEISLSSIISNWSGLSGDAETNRVGKLITGKMLKTAAALHVVTQSHGAYQSRARKFEHNKRQVLVPVNYSSDSRSRLRASAE